MFNALIILVILGKFKGRLGTLRDCRLNRLVVYDIIIKYAYFNFLFLPMTIPTLKGILVFEPILISISLKSKTDDTSYCCRVYHSPRNGHYF